MARKIVKPLRKRAKPFMIWLSEDEMTKLDQLLARETERRPEPPPSRSSLIRAWLGKQKVGA